MGNVSALTLLSLILVTVSGEDCDVTTPPMCTCESGSTTKVCRASNVDEIPSNFPAGAAEIHVIESHLDYILHVSNLPNVTELYLSKNGIRFLGNGAFMELFLLTKLILADNALSGLGNKTFNGLSSLQFLDISGNRLYEIGDDVFTGLKLMSLSTLYLSGSRLYTISPNAIHDLHKLQILDLSHNELIKVPRLDGCEKLLRLDLSYNDIYELNGSPFSGLPKLKYLTLTHNDINRLSEDIFVGLSQLQELRLSRNSLHSLGDTAFSSLTNLNVLDVSENSLQSLAESTVLLDSVETLIIHSNPWHCNCSTTWLRNDDIIRSNNPENKMVCASPASVSDVSIYNANIHVFDCPSNDHGFHSSTVALAVGLLIAVALITVGSIALYKYTTRKRIRRHTGSPSSSSPYSRVLFEGDSGNI